jgi:hypothetical protein
MKIYCQIIGYTRLIKTFIQAFRFVRSILMYSTEKLNYHKSGEAC